MSVFKRMSEVMQEKLSHVLSAAENPAEALDLSYEKQVEALQQVRRSVADVLTSEKRLELQAAQLRQNQAKLQEQARTALQQGREDLARLALQRSQEAQTQLDGMAGQIDQLKAQEQKLELTAQKLQAKVEAFRTQKETLKAEYTAASASTKVGEAVTGLSEEMADTSMMIDRAREKTAQMQARAAAIDQLVDTGTLDQIGVDSSADIDRQLQAASSDAAVAAQLDSMKRQLQAAASAGMLQAPSRIVRIQGEDQYRLPLSDYEQLEQIDRKLHAAVVAGQEPAFKATLNQALELVRDRGQKLAVDEIRPSDAILPSPDMTLIEAKAVIDSESVAVAQPHPLEAHLVST